MLGDMFPCLFQMEIELITFKRNPHPNTTFRVITSNSKYPITVLGDTSRIVYAQNKNNDIMQFYITNIKR